LGLIRSGATENLRWIDLTRILFTNGGGLRLGAPGGTGSVIDTGVTGGSDFGIS
jgi:hypothetical protein